MVLGPAVDFYVRKIRAFKYRDRFIMDKLETEDCLQNLETQESWKEILS